MISCADFFLKIIYNTVLDKVPSTLQDTTQTTMKNLMRNVKQNPDHSQLILTQEKWEKEKKKK